MPQKITLKSVIILGVVALFAYLLHFTLLFNSMSKEEQKKLAIENPKRYEKLLKNSIKLGLDLQGGMHLVMEVDVKALLEKIAKNKDERFYRALEAAAKEAEESEASFVDIFDQKLTEEGVNLSLYYGSREFRDHDEILSYLKKQAQESINRTLEILRNRVDQFGVSEPSIQKQGHNRIIIELAGVTDRQRALDLVGKTAKLEFRLLKDPQVAQRIASRINEYLTGGGVSEDTSKVLAEKEKSSKQDTSAITAEELLGNPQKTASESLTVDTTAVATSENPEFGENLFFASGRGLSIKESNIPRFYKVMEDPKVKEIIEMEAGEADILLGKPDARTHNLPPDKRFVPVYVVNAKPALTGETIVDATPRVGSANDPNAFGKFETDLTFNDQGAKDFARVTGANVGKPLAIILDGKVHSAPVIRDKIRNGRAVITGLESIEEAKDLAIVLKAGALPAPAKIIEERTVGPSLGKDSIEKGYKSAVLGLILVALFMLVYYKFSGFLADVALVLNILILLGFMAALHATLTLPGIAGIILTIGMAVDANVLIFERIREELEVGKSVWASLETGYSRAFITILDANVTTFIAAVVLYNFGSGPIRGFATTLMIGITASMFTAIFVTRTLFELLLSKKILKRMSI